MSDFEKKVKKLKELDDRITAEEKNGCIYLSGEVDDWNTVVKAGRIAVDKKYIGVVNDVKLKGFVQKQYVPPITDNALDGLSPDVLIIGAGLVGAATARELSKYDLDVLVVEKGADVAAGQSSRNGGAVHVGINYSPSSQKHKYNYVGNRMYTDLARDLDVPFERLGHLLLIAKKWEQLLPRLLVLNSRRLKIPGVRYVDRKGLLKIEPYAPSWATGALYMPTGGFTSPYKMCVALMENALENGAKIALNTMVSGMDVENGKITAVKTNRGTLHPTIVVNCAGVYTDVIADMAGDRTFTIHPRKGTDIILDKKKVGYALSSYARSYFAPLPKEAQPDKQEEVGHTKGGGVMRTIDGNILVGPDAHEVPSREDYSTSIKDIDNIIKKQKLAQPMLNKGDIITYFSGTRAATYEEDFVVRRGMFTKNIYEAAGIQSPGITAAPAIAVDIANWIKEDLKAEEKTNFNPVYKHTPRLANLPDEERAKYIAKNPEYGEIICRCEEVSKGEIVDALESPLKVATIDGIKRRVRPGMGRCQGGFCSPLVAKIIAEHEGIEIEDVLKGDEGSVIVYGNTKGNAKEEN